MENDFNGNFKKSCYKRNVKKILGQNDCKIYTIYAAILNPSRNVYNTLFLPFLLEENAHIQ